MICGILKPTSGTVTCDGLTVSSEEYRAQLGYLPQDFGYYPDFTGMDFLLYMASLKGLSRSAARRKSVELLNTVSLQDQAKKKNKNLLRRNEAAVRNRPGSSERSKRSDPG